MVSVLEELFPSLVGSAYQVTSPHDSDYNCIAWAAGVTDTWWWPSAKASKEYWPDGVPRERSQPTFVAAFALLGYAVCASTELEAGYEKVALFANAAGQPTHAARQLPSGRWTSKLGKAQDIEHELRALEGRLYGSVAIVLKRPVQVQANQ